MSPQHDKKAPDTLAPKPGEPHYVIPAETYTRPTPRNDAPARSFWARIDHPFVVGFVLTLGGLAAIVLGLAISNLSTVIIYIVLAMFAALGLTPVVDWLTRRGLKRTWAIAAVFVGFALIPPAAPGIIVPAVATQITQFVSDIPGLVTSFRGTDLYRNLENSFGDGLNDLVKQVQSFLTDPGNLATIGGGAFQVGVGIVSAISGGVITLVLTLYFIASLPSIKQGFYRLTPARGRENLAALTEQITGSIGGYLMGMVALALANAVIAFILHLVLGLPFPALMAMVAFLITLIPLVGSVLFWVIASTLALFTSPLSALIFAICYLIYMQIEAYLLTPRIMNRAISIPGALVVIGALVGGTLLGLIGALVAIPVSASILLIITQVWVPKQDAKTDDVAS